MHKNLLLLFLFFMALNASGQQDSTEADSSDTPIILRPDNTVPWKVGVKFGSGVSTLVGSEMSNSTLAYALCGGMYGRYRFPKKFIVQAELSVAMRGSYFDHKTGEYQLIRLYYIDLPLLVCYPLNVTRNTNVVAGLQYSYLINSFLYVKMNPPVAEALPPRLNKHDMLAVLGMQFYTPWVGFQLVGKYSLLDLNNNFLPPSTPPNPPIQPANRGGDIRNFVIELNFIF